MSKQAGRGGMGNHKHGVSGVSGPSPRFKFMRTLEDNEERRALKERRKAFRTRWLSSVKEAFNAALSKKK